MNIFYIIMIVIALMIFVLNIYAINSHENNKNKYEKIAKEIKKDTSDYEKRITKIFNSHIIEIENMIMETFEKVIKERKDKGSGKDE